MKLSKHLTELTQVVEATTNCKSTTRQNKLIPNEILEKIKCEKEAKAIWQKHEISANKKVLSEITKTSKRL